MQLNTLYYQAPTNLEETKQKINQSLMMNGGSYHSISPDITRYEKGGFIGDLVFEEKEDRTTTILVRCSTTTGRVVWGVIFLLLFFPLAGLLAGLYILAYSNFQTSLNIAGAHENVHIRYNNLGQN